MANSYCVIQLTLKWAPKLFFHFLALTVLNSWIFFIFMWGKMCPSILRLVMVWNVIIEARRSQDSCTLVWL